jgi:hypothetical protein
MIQKKKKKKKKAITHPSLGKHAAGLLADDSEFHGR